MEKFIYVFSKEARDKLLENGYSILKEDEKADMYVFVNRAEQTFDILDVSYICSDSLIF